jgi:hypothetical protein
MCSYVKLPEVNYHQVTLNPINIVEGKIPLNPINVVEGEIPLKSHS